MTEQFTAPERHLIRTEFMVRWGIAPSLDEGIQLGRWAGGPHKGQPKLKAPVQTMLERGLVEIFNPERGIPFAFFTEAGFEALRAMAKSRTFLPPAQYGHVLTELAGRPVPAAPAPAKPARKRPLPRKT
jgi:hypothetical protein